MQHSFLCGRLCLLVVLAGLALPSAGCGGVANVPQRDAAVEPPADSALPDSAVAPRCDPTKPFGQPTVVPNINSTGRDQGAQLVDELTLYFGSDRSGSAGLYVATRSSPTSPFSTPVPLSAINMTGAASGPALTGDGLTMYYAVASAQTLGDIYVTARADKGSTFLAGTPVVQVNSTTEDLDPFITADGAALYFDSARGSTALHLYTAVRRTDGSFDVPQALTNLNTNVTDGHPVVSRDGLTIYWSSTRTDGGHQGGTDMWMATRPSTAGAFGTPTRVPELSSVSNESVSWIAPDSCVAYLQSDRTGSTGSADIWVAIRPM